MVARNAHVRAVTRLLRQFPVVAILGARQTGKTTLARQVAAAAKSEATVIDLEDPRQLSRLADPMLALEPLTGLVVLDEVQLRPDLFSALRVLADRPGTPARFLVLGSASPALLRQSAETLAGRIVFHELRGFSLPEVGTRNVAKLWLRGGFPRSYLAASGDASLTWRRAFLQTFVERDLPQLGVSTGAETMRRFWAMLAHWHGQVWNAAEFARSFGVSEMTVRRYLDTLVATYAVRRLAPWSESLAKRQVKSPKVYVADSGMLHALLDLGSMDDLTTHPKLGASFEGFAVDVVADALGARPDECHFWATHQGAELDLLVVRGRTRVGFEIKRTSAPEVTKSMRIALDDLRLDRIDVIHAGTDTYPLTDRIRAVAIARVPKDIAALPRPK
ncbi:MAG: ATP-binding protein [Planctomycetes bacterium]|nr:ATP-binding protein [Planctomycetota bacterium]